MHPTGNLRFPMGMRVLATIWITLFGGFVTVADARAQAVRINVRPRPVHRIAPGTVVRDAAPRGWTHLILKSQPRVAAGDVRTVPKIVLRNSDFLFTAFVARVVGQGPYQLSQVGVGLGTEVGEQPMIISSDTHRQLGADLGLLRSTVLSQSEKKLDLIVYVARTPTMAVFDAPGYYALPGGHVPIALRYHVLVDANSGALSTITWLLQVDSEPPQYQFAENSVRLLAPNLVEDSILAVDEDEFVVGVPKPSAFALTALPPGQPLPMTPALRVLADQPRFQAKEVVQLEQQLRELIQGADARDP